MKLFPAFLIGLLAAVPARSPSDLLRVDASEEAMGTTFSVVLYGADRERLEEAARAALGEAHRLDHLLSNYDPSSEWSRVNALAAREPVIVSRELFDLLERCATYSRLSDGAFDITVGPLMRVWQFYKGEGGVPAPDELRRAAALVGSRHVTLDREHLTVSFDRSGVELDPGGIGKGYAVDRLVAILKARDVSIAFVSAGGSSLFGLGAPPDDPRGWKVAIRAPDNPRQSVAEVFLKDASLSTSGSYEKFFRAGGRIYSHLMDPRTGYPAPGASAVSVIAPATIDSEAWAKPYFINGRTWAGAHKPANQRVFFCDDKQPPQCGWVQ